MSNTVLVSQLSDDDVKKLEPIAKYWVGHSKVRADEKDDLYNFLLMELCKARVVANGRTDIKDFDRWVSTAMKSKILNFKRGQARQAVRHPVVSNLNSFNAVGAVDDSADDRAGIQAEDVREALDVLSANEKAVIQAAFFSNEPRADVCERLKITEREFADLKTSALVKLKGVLS